MPVEALMFVLVFIYFQTGLLLFHSLQFTSFQEAEPFNCLVTGELQVYFMVILAYNTPSQQRGLEIVYSLEREDYVCE